MWNYESRNGKQTKVPYRADAPTQRASVTDGSSWGTFAAAYATVEDGRADGIGFVLGDGVAGVDIDRCHDSKTGEVTEAALAVITKLNSYTEVSPSGTGVKVFVCGALAPRGRRKANLEMYDGGRYFTVTGQHLEGTPTTIEERTAELAALHAQTFASDHGAPRDDHHEDQPSSGADAVNDGALINRAISARNGGKFASLWYGHWQGDYASQSEADLALCGQLAFWTRKDAARMDRLFRQSGLMRSKWDEPHYANRRTYGEGTIIAANDRCQDVYQAPATGTSGTHDTRPPIDAGDRELRRISGKALTALRAANTPPRLFQYGGLRVRIEHDDDDLPELRPLIPDRLRYELARAARFQIQTKDGPVPALPPMHVVRDLLASPKLNLPKLTAITRAPTFGPNGSLHQSPGYDAETLMYYAPTNRFSLPPVPAEPSPDDIGIAKRWILDDLLGDFPFVGDAERAHAVALLLQPFMRPLITGPTPLYLIEKPTPGTGGSLLVTVLLFPAIGGEAGAMTEGRDEDEWRKRVTARLRSGGVAIVIDNLRRPLDSSALAAAITASVHEDRLLGTSDIVRLPVRCAWVATGNNPTLSPELSRRAVRTRLDAQVDRPWMRTGFRHDDLLGWVSANRGQLVWAALVLGRAWIVAGQPRGDRTLGMFEQWARVMGGILGVAEIAGFLDNLTALYDDADAEGTAWRGFIEQWWDAHQDQPVGVADLWSLVEPITGDPIDLNLGDGNERSQKTRLGKRLAEMRDRQFGDLRLTRGDDVKGAHRWRLVNVA